MIHLIVVQKKPIYLTEETDAETVRRMVLHKCGTAGAALTWDMEGLFFRYESVRSGTVIMGAGVVPLMGGGEEPLFSRERREFILNTALVLLILITSAGILVLGRYLARLLSVQILSPLEEMRIAAAAIQRGNFDHALPLMGNDEVGTTCRAFDAVQIEARPFARTAGGAAAQRAFHRRPPRYSNTADRHQGLCERTPRRYCADA